MPKTTKLMTLREAYELGYRDGLAGEPTVDDLQTERLTARYRLGFTDACEDSEHQD